MPVHHIDDSCGKQRHVTRSTFSAELLAHGDEADPLMMLAQAQVAHADGGGGGAGGAGGGGVSRQPWGREPDGESDESDAEVGAQRQQGEEGLNKTAQSSARSDVHLRSRERVLMLSRLRELEHLTELKDTTIETLERLIAEVV